MNFEKRNIRLLLAFMLIGGLLGHALGNLLAGIFPSISIMQTSLTGPVGFNLEIISFYLKLNLSAITGLILGVIIFRKI